MMQAISESDTASSWPAGYERHIQDWADAGDPSAPPPFDDRYGIVTPEFFSRLHALRQLCGGWLYWNDDRNCIVFAPELEWQRVRSAQEGAEAKRQSDQRESQARLQRYAIRLDEVMSIARSDKAFWEELRTWELGREAKRPSELLSHRPLVGPIRVEHASPAGQAKLENMPIDPIFASFIARVRKPDDVLTVHDIVLNLRGAMRRELSLDGALGWPAGPGIGVA